MIVDHFHIDWPKHESIQIAGIDPITKLLARPETVRVFPLRDNTALGNAVGCANNHDMMAG
ncbi:MAG: hypothetical protein B6D82_14590 [gamma proteobacterium symbiont of Ctena orbiculata]|nr:MAG: hypothetical protein B6D82_14590 [gamma proteobacterium symbiont of Ctena orbiculata]